MKIFNSTQMNKLSPQKIIGESRIKKQTNGIKNVGFGILMKILKLYAQDQENPETHKIIVKH